MMAKNNWAIPLGKINFKLYIAVIFVHAWQGLKMKGEEEYKGCTRQKEQTEHKKHAK